MRSFIIIFSLMTLSGCAVWDQFKDSVGLIPESSEIELIIDSDKYLNARENGLSSPVILRVYELSSPILFRSLDFFALFENDQASLGDEYIKRYEFELQPSENLHQFIQLQPETRALGFSVAFRNMNGSSWRTVKKIEERKSYFYKVYLSGSELHVDNTKGVEQIYF